MARGFESKSVTSQQESAFGALDRPRERVDPLVQQRRRRLELARSDALRQLEAARAEAHRLTLRRTLEALDAELASLSDPPKASP